MKPGYKVQGYNKNLSAVLYSFTYCFIIGNTLILFLVMLLPIEVLGQQNPYESVIFWNGVNGNWFNSSSNIYSWQDNINNLIRNLQENENEYARPFEINAKEKQNPSALSTNLNSYLLDCEKTGKKPVIVFVPNLNIMEYILTLLPNKLFPPVFRSESVVRKDKKWIHLVTPIVMNELERFGYKTYGYAHSYGAEMVCKGLEYSGYPLSNLTIINGRTSLNRLNKLQKLGKVKSTLRITTYTDAPTYSGKAAFGKGDIHIVNVDGPNWGNMKKNHSFFLIPPSTKITYESNGKTSKSDLGTLLKIHKVSNTQLTESGVSMRMDIDSKGMVKDTTETLNELKRNLLESRSQGDTLFWLMKKDEQK